MLKHIAKLFPVFVILLFVFSGISTVFAQEDIANSVTNTNSNSSCPSETSNSEWETITITTTITRLCGGGISIETTILVKTPKPQPPCDDPCKARNAPSEPTVIEGQGGSGTGVTYIRILVYEQRIVVDRCGCTRIEYVPVEVIVAIATD